MARARIPVSSHHLPQTRTNDTLTTRRRGRHPHTKIPTPRPTPDRPQNSQGQPKHLQKTDEKQPPTQTRITQRRNSVKPKIITPPESPSDKLLTRENPYSQPPDRNQNHRKDSTRTASDQTTGELKGGGGVIHPTDKNKPPNESSEKTTPSDRDSYQKEHLYIPKTRPKQHGNTRPTRETTKITRYLKPLKHGTVKNLKPFRQATDARRQTTKPLLNNNAYGRPHCRTSPDQRADPPRKPPRPPSRNVSEQYQKTPKTKWKARQNLKREQQNQTTHSPQKNIEGGQQHTNAHREAEPRR